MSFCTVWHLPLAQVGGVDVIGITAEVLAATGEFVLQVKELAAGSGWGTVPPPMF